MSFLLLLDDSGFGTGLQGHLTPEMKNASEIYTVAEYINEYGAMPKQ